MAPVRKRSGVTVIKTQLCLVPSLWQDIAVLKVPGKTRTDISELLYTFAF